MLTIDSSQLGSSSEKSNRDLDAARFAKMFSSLKAAPYSSSFYAAVGSPPISQVEECSKWARELKGKFENFIFIGIGGSSLGPIALLDALKTPNTSSAVSKIRFVENPDPIGLANALHGLNPKTTFVCPITKSGGTFETISLFRAVSQWLDPHVSGNLKAHLGIITDPHKGDLRVFAKNLGLSTLEIHPEMGGRFSVFSPVGLFPLELAGLSSKQFLEGAKKMRDSLEKNPAPLLSISRNLIDLYPQRKIHVMMPYANALKTLGAWFVQLWAESLGKDGKGFTPLGALGANDQHSLLQLLRDGPDDKVTHFIGVKDFGTEPILSTILPGTSGLDSFEILNGKKLSELLRIEMNAIKKVLTNCSRPSWSIELDRVDEENLGALMFFYCSLTAAAGALWEINPFDQPGVEEGKVYIRNALLTR